MTSVLYRMLCASPAARPAAVKRPIGAGQGGRVRLLRGLVPAVEALLQAFGRLFRGLAAVEHVGGRGPGLVLEVGRAARQHLVGRPDRGLAVLAPTDELGGDRIL